MAPVMDTLEAAQREIMALSGSDLKKTLKNVDKVPNVGIMGMFEMQPDEFGAGMRVLENVITLVDYVAAYGMGHLSMEQKFHLFISSAFSKALQNLWQASYRAAPASTTGIGLGSKIYVAFLNIFAAYSTTSDKRKILQIADEFSYNVRGFKATWRDLVEFSSLLDHTVMTTSAHCYSRHRLELWPDAKKIDFFIDMFSVAGEAWVIAAMTRPGAEQITMVTAAGEYLSTHVPEDGPVGDCGALHALTHGRQGVPVQCFSCQEMGHIIANCPHKAQGTGTPAATVPYNRPSAPHQHPNTSAQDMAHDMDATRHFQEASAAEHRMEARTQKLHLLCKRIELVCDRIPRATAAERTAGALHTLSLPRVEAREHKVRTGQDDVEVMARAMEAACRCEIVADTTQVLDADWGKFHNPCEHARPRQVKRWGEGP